MAAFILPGRGARGQRPSGPLQLNRASPQAMGLARWYPLLGVYAPTLHGAPELPNTPTLNTGTSGQYPRLNGAPLYEASWWSNASVNIGDFPEITVTARVLSTNVSDYRNWVGNSFNSNWRVRHTNAGNWNLLDRGGTNQITGSATISANVEYLVGFTGGAASPIQLYHNGIADGSAGSNFGGGVSGIVFEIGGSGSSAGALSIEPWLGYIYDLRIYNRVLSPVEMYSLYANPWDLYWVLGRRMFFDVGAAPATGRTSRLAFMGVS